MNPTPLELDVVVQCYRDMVCMGEEDVYQVKTGTPNRLQMRPGGVQMNGASLLLLSLDHVERFIDGWYTGMANLTFDHAIIGNWRPFQFNIYNDDAPSVVHFKPSALFMGWQPQDTKLDQCIYSFAIRPWKATPDVSRETES
jgi:hypothetical protein